MVSNTLDPANLPPGEGNIIDYHHPETILPQLIRLNKQYGDQFKARFPEQDSWVYVLCHPDLAKQVLANHYKNYRKGVGIDLVNVLLGRGIMVSEGELWKRQRKMLQPMFNRDILQQLMPLMTRCTSQVITDLQNTVAAGKLVNITEVSSHAALNFILFALFSEDLSRIIDETGSNPFLMVTDDSTRDLQFARRFRSLSSLIVEMIERRQRESRYPADILTLIMHANEKGSGEAMPQKLQLDEILTIIIAGHETTASALNWTWYLISQHADVEQRLLEETQQVLNGANPGWKELNRLTYTRQVLEESMRLYPPGWLLTRRAINDDEIGGFYVPAGTDIFIPTYLIHRHTNFWPQPERFKPERFSPQQKAAHHQGAYLAFSMGPRNCIGEAMALNEMIIHISMIIQSIHFDLAPGQSIELKALVNLRPEHDLLLHASNR